MGLEPDMEIQVNGKQYSLAAVDEQKSLLSFLRDDLHLTGTRYGCGAGLCGACTVHLDGIATRACQTRVTDAIGHAVTTIEHLGSDAPHPVQQAFIEHQVPQCGFCCSGQIMTLAAMLDKEKPPPEAEIHAALSGHLCRCGNYPRARAALEALLESNG